MKIKTNPMEEIIVKRKTRLVFDYACVFFIRHTLELNSVCV